MKPFSGGILLVELVISLSLVVIFASGSLYLGSRLLQKSLDPLALAIKFHIESLRTFASMSDQDLHLEVNAKSITSSDTLGQEISVRDYPGISLSLNVPKWGFKPSLNTKYAGSLRLENSYASSTLTLPVGLAVLSKKATIQK